MTLPRSKSLFIDRDGIFNEIVMRDGQMTSPRDWSEIKHYPGLEGLPELKALGYLLILITNQPDIERGIITASFTDDLHAHYRKTYGLDAVYVCPFAANSHPWKKPNAGMFSQAAEDFRIELAWSFHLGDTERDVGAAKNCGCKSILWDRPYNQDLASDFRVRSLEELRAILATG